MDCRPPKGVIDGQVRRQGLADHQGQVVRPAIPQHGEGVSSHSVPGHGGRAARLLDRHHEQFTAAGVVVAAGGDGQKNCLPIVRDPIVEDCNGEIHIGGCRRPRRNDECSQPGYGVGACNGVVYPRRCRPPQGVVDGQVR